LAVRNFVLRSLTLPLSLTQGEATQERAAHFIYPGTELTIGPLSRLQQQNER